MVCLHSSGYIVSEGDSGADRGDISAGDATLVRGSRMDGTSGISLRAQAYACRVCSRAAESRSGISIPTGDNSQGGGTSLNCGMISIGCGIIVGTTGGTTGNVAGGMIGGAAGGAVGIPVGAGGAEVVGGGNDSWG